MDDILHKVWAWIVFVVALLTIIGFCQDAFASGCFTNCEESFTSVANMCQTTYADPIYASHCIESSMAIYMVCVQACSRNVVSINPDGTIGNQDLQGVPPQGDCPSTVASVDCRNKRAKRSYP